MRTSIKIKSPNTENYWKYLISEIGKHRPFDVGERVAVQIEEWRTPMPEFQEIPTPPGRIIGEMKDKDGKVIGVGYVGFDPRRTIGIQIADEKHIFDSRIGALWDYTNNRLTELCSLHSGSFSDDQPMKATLYMTVVNPEKIDKEIWTLDTETQSHEEEKSSSVQTPSQLKKNPLRICIRDKKIPITEGTIQSRVIEIMFDHPLNSLVELDELVDKTYGADILNPAEKWKNIHNALYLVNEKIKQSSGEKIFRLGKTRFFRVR